ncbi:MAG: hypothetical protein QW478_07150 [Candidatus Micrarchaeaceae archaeon]
MDEIKSGRSGLIPNDVTSQLEEIASVVRMKRDLGMSDDELHTTFVRGLSMKETRLDATDLLRVANLFKGYEQELQKIAERCIWLVER